MLVADVYVQKIYIIWFMYMLEDFVDFKKFWGTYVQYIHTWNNNQIKVSVLLEHG